MLEFRVKISYIIGDRNKQAKEKIKTLATLDYTEHIELIQSNSLDLLANETARFMATFIWLT